MHFLISYVYFLSSAVLAFGWKRRNHRIDESRRRRRSSLRICRSLSSQFCSTDILTICSTAILTTCSNPRVTIMFVTQLVPQFLYIFSKDYCTTKDYCTKIDCNDNKLRQLGLSNWISINSKSDIVKIRG